MSEQNATVSGEGHEVQLWEPQRALKQVAPAAAALSCGFLRCRPEAWFPGFVERWLTVTHALGFETRLADVKPVQGKPPTGVLSFVGAVSGEDIVVAIEDSTAQALREELVPGADPAAGAVVLEYFVRRFMSSLGLTWSGPQAATVEYRRDGDAANVPVVGSIRVSFTINTTPCTVWVGLGEKVVSMLDGLWRRQIQQLSKSVAGSSTLRFEIAQLLVPPQMLSEYLTKGTVIDLEVKASDAMTVKLGSKAWMPGRLVDVGGMLGCEISPGGLAIPSTSEGTTQLCVEIATLSVDSGRLAELSQSGAIVVTDAPVSGKVQLSINQEKVGNARLCVYEGRFAIEVE